MDTKATEIEVKLAVVPPPAKAEAKPAAPLLAQCEKCADPARGDKVVETAARRGLCAKCFEAEVAKPTGAVKTVEEWAKAKTMDDSLEPGVTRRVPNAKAGVRVVSVNLKESGVTARRVNESHAAFLGAKLANKWPVGHECTEAEFDHATAATAAVICR